MQGVLVTSDDYHWLVILFFRLLEHVLEHVELDLALLNHVNAILAHIHNDLVGFGFFDTGIARLGQCDGNVLLNLGEGGRHQKVNQQQEHAVDHGCHHDLEFFFFLWDISHGGKRWLYGKETLCFSALFQESGLSHDSRFTIHDSLAFFNH